eukprot:UN22507
MSDTRGQSVKDLVLEVGWVESLRIEHGNEFNRESRVKVLKQELNDKLSDGDKVLIELLLTEKTYLIHVENLIKFLKVQQEKQDNRTVSELLKPLLIIYSSNKNFYDDLEKTLKGYKSATLDFPNIFLEFFPYFKNYINYVKNFVQFSASPFYDKWKDEYIPGECNLILRDIIIKPIQRVTKYNLLLKDALKKTPKTHEGYEKLQESHESAKKVTTEINHKKGILEKQRRVSDIESKVGRITPSIVEPHRRFILEGYLEVLIGGRKCFKKFKFYLFN